MKRLLDAARSLPICLFLGILLASPLLATDISVKRTSKCDFSDLQEPMKSLVAAYKKAEDSSLGEKVRPQKDKAIELILRSKTKNWNAFTWMLRPLEVVAAMSAQETYSARCKTQQGPLLPSLLADFESDRISMKDKKKSMRIFFLLSPCLDEESLASLQKTSAHYFYKNIEDYVNLIITSESEMPAFAVDYQACSAKPKKTQPYALTDSLFAGIETLIEKNGINKSLVLRVKRLRQNKTQFKSAQYFFEKLDSLIIKNEKTLRP